MLYRQRLQVERDLRAGAMAGDAVLGAETPVSRTAARSGPLEDLGRLVRSGAAAVLEAAADERTGEASIEWRARIGAGPAGRHRWRRRRPRRSSAPGRRPTRRRTARDRSTAEGRGSRSRSTGPASPAAAQEPSATS